MSEQSPLFALPERQEEQLTPATAQSQARVVRPNRHQLLGAARPGCCAGRRQLFRAGRAFTGEAVALRAAADGVWDVYYCLQRITTLDLTLPRDL